MDSYIRGQRVVVEGHGGRRAILVVWQDQGRGISLTSEAGYRRLIEGDREAPVVGYPRRDVRAPAD